MTKIFTKLIQLRDNIRHPYITEARVISAAELVSLIFGWSSVTISDFAALGMKFD